MRELASLCRSVGPCSKPGRHPLMVKMSREGRAYRGLKVMGHVISSSRRRGSPLLIGVRSKYKLSTEQIPILYRTCEFPEDISSQLQGSHPLAASSVCRQPYRQHPQHSVLDPAAVWLRVSKMLMQWTETQLHPLKKSISL